MTDLKERAKKLLFDKEWAKDLPDEHTYPRVRWLRNFRDYANEHNLAGSAAECGVYRGSFAYYINKYFPGKTLYLFDTFEGFDDQDIDEELTHDSAFVQSPFSTRGFFKGGTREDWVLEKMPHPQQCVIKKGYFPDSAHDVSSDEQFCFVNLDMDLYQPMLAGLRCFYSRMMGGGGE
jgi:hypothetical protein